jgi:hypothetical protein
VASYHLSWFGSFFGVGTGTYRSYLRQWFILDRSALLAVAEIEGNIEVFEKLIC